MAKRKNEPTIAAAPAAADADATPRGVNAYVLRPGKTKGRAGYGHRRTVCLQEWAQVAIIALYPNALPIIIRSHDRAHALRIYQTHLAERVNEYLRKLAKQNHVDAEKYRRSGYADQKISRQTVRLALKALQDAN